MQMVSSLLSFLKITGQLTSSFLQLFIIPHIRLEQKPLANNVFPTVLQSNGIHSILTSIILYPPRPSKLHWKLTSTNYTKTNDFKFCLLTCLHPTYPLSLLVTFLLYTRCACVCVCGKQYSDYVIIIFVGEIWRYRNGHHYYYYNPGRTVMDIFYTLASSEHMTDGQGNNFQSQNKCCHLVFTNFNCPTLSLQQPSIPLKWMSFVMHCFFNTQVFMRFISNNHVISLQ